MPADETASPPTTPPPAAERLLSLDVYRGIVMLLLASSGFGIAKYAAKLDGPFAKWLVFQGTHPDWNSQFSLFGLALWDLIQPAFMFIVGVSMPFSYEKRAKLGESYASRMRHAWTRALLLTLLGVFLQSQRYDDTYWIFTNVLSQIGLGYGFLFFLVGKSWRTQFITGGAILIGYYVLMILLPRGLDSWRMHFENGTSFPQYFDIWFLNLFPREKPFEIHPYATLSFIPSIVTMLMGLMSGQVLKDDTLTAKAKLKRLGVAAGILLVTGAILGLTICPVVKKIWTPSWALYSGGWVVGLLALCYWAIDVKQWKGWIFPFVVVGLNPLTMYLLGMMTTGWFKATLHRHLPDFILAGPTRPIVEATLLVIIFWLILWWMYRRKIFLRL